jgi:hypothetical protein
MDTYKLVSTADKSDVNVKVSSDAGKRKVSEAVTPERGQVLQFISIHSNSLLAQSY